MGNADRNPSTQPMFGVGQWPAPTAMWSSPTLGRPPRSAVEMWVSMFPFAPLFGVRWFWLGFGPLSGDDGATTTTSVSFTSGPERAAAETKKLAMDGAAFATATAPIKLDQSPAERGKTGPSSIAANATATMTTPLSATTVQTTAEAKPIATASPALTPANSDIAPKTAAPSSSTSAATPSKPAVAPLPAAPSAAARTDNAPTFKPTPSMKPVLSVMPTPEGRADVAKPAGLFDQRPTRVDDLKTIHGIGPRLEQLLNEVGVYQLEQIAAFTSDELRWLDERLFVIKGRAERDGWVASAKKAIAERDA